MARPERIPCPFCGTWDTRPMIGLGGSQTMWNVCCLAPECGAMGPGAFTKKEAERLWDQRDKRWEQQNGD